MRQYRDDEAVDFVIVGTGAGGGTLGCKLAEYGFSVVAPMPDLTGVRSKILHPTSANRPALLDRRARRRWRRSASTRFQQFREVGRRLDRALRHGVAAISAGVVQVEEQLGYGTDWPLDWREMWTYYGEVEQALKIAGPINYPWGPERPRYPYRAHELNAAALVLAEGAQALGIAWSPTPLATVSAPTGLSPPCVYRGMCTIGCSTNAKQSVLVTGFAASSRGRCRAPRPRHGRTRRAQQCRPCDRRALSARGTVALSARPQRRGRWLRNRNPATASQLCHGSVSRWLGEQLRARRQEPYGSVEPSRLGPDGAGDPRL